jgi:hypothetical protein
VVNEWAGVLRGAGLQVWATRLRVARHALPLRGSGAAVAALDELWAPCCCVLTVLDGGGCRAGVPYGAAVWATRSVSCGMPLPASNGLRC